MATINGTNGNDTLDGSAGNDSISGKKGDDWLDGANGNDSLYGNEGKDTLYGGDGNDLLDGGASNDELWGGDGSDTYVFNRGGGVDSVDHDEDDTLLFGANIRPQDIDVQTNVESVTFAIRGTKDAITLDYYFDENTGDVYVPLKAVKFADGTVWNTNKIKQLALEGDDTSQDLRGFSSDDSISGLGGDDRLVGYDGDDTLLGGAGNDDLYDGDGDDILDGGTGNDYLNGEYGDDTFVFGRGYGSDTIDNGSEGDAEGDDTLLFKSDIKVADVKVKRSDDDLVLTFKNSSKDKVTIRDYFEGIDPLENIKFADGTTWHRSKIDALVGAPATDSLVEAMAAFEPVAAGEASMSIGDASALSPVIAAV